MFIFPTKSLLHVMTTIYSAEQETKPMTFFHIFKKLENALKQSQSHHFQDDSATVKP